MRIDRLTTTRPVFTGTTIVIFESSSTMRVSAGLLVLAMTFAPAAAGDVPFATPPALKPDSNNAYVPSLDEIMQLVQLTHIKIWHAGAAANWAVAAFEIDQIENSFAKAATFYDKIPIAYVLALKDPLDDMRRASDAKDIARFDKGYAELTAACNGCHRAAGVGFIVVKTPTFPAVSDQKF